MKIKGKITILINREYTMIELKDADAGITFCEIQLSPEQLVAALSRLGQVPCVIDLNGLEKIGKTMENKKFEFEIPDELRGSSNSEKLHEIATSLLSDGWQADCSFSSQDTFFKKDGKQYARCIIRRWV